MLRIPSEREAAIPDPNMTSTRRRDFAHLLIALATVAGVTALYAAWLQVTNHTTVAVSYLLIVLFVAAAWPLWIAIVTSVAAMLALNYFFFPPLGTLSIARGLITSRTASHVGGRSSASSR